MPTETPRPYGAMRRIAMAACFLALASGPLPAREHNVKPARGLVPDAPAAIAIAVAVWTPIYGASKIASEKPYVARLEHGQWTVRGSLPEGWLGGVAIAVISQSDGRVLRVSHGR